MRSKIKRVLSIALAATICFSSVSLEHVFAKNSNVIVEDDFSSTLKKWKDNDVGNVADGTYQLGDGKFNILKATDKENIVISADVTVKYSKNSNQMASVFVAANDDASKGYEFGIGIAKSGIPYARLYLRGNADNSQILYQVTEDIPGTPYGKIESGENYNIQLGVKNGQIRCLINGEVVCSINDTTYNKGNVGIKSRGDTAVFDNVKLSRIGEKSVQGITLLNTPETAAVYSLLEFDVVADCGDYYGTETIPSTHKDVKITGFDNTAGTKKVTVTYGGKSASFTLKVTEKFQSTTLLTQKFTNEAEITENFPLNNPSYPIDYHWEISNNKLIARYPTSIGNFDSVAQMSSTLKSAVSSSWSQNEAYEIILNTAIVTKNITPTNRTSFTGVSFAKDDATGGEYLITIAEDGLATVSCTDTGRVLQKNNINLYVKDLKVQLGKTFELRVQVCDSVMRAFYNQHLICVVPLSLEDTSPWLRLRAGNGTINYSDLTVKTLQTRDPQKASEIVMKKVNDRKEVRKIIGSEIDLSFYYLDVTYSDGKTQQIVPTEDMLSGYKKGKNSKVTVTCGRAKTSFSFEYIDALFIDTFEDAIHPGWTRSNNTYYTQKIKNAALDTTFNYSGTFASDNFTVTNGSDWTDYTVSTDFSFARDTRYNNYAGMFHLIFRYQNSKNYYTLRFQQQGNNISGFLGMAKDGLSGLVSVATFKTARLNMLMDETKSLTTGQTFNVAVRCIGNTFFIYFENQLIYTYTDTADDALLYGTAGMRHQYFTGTVDNFTVIDETDGFSAMVLEGVKDNTFEIYEGGEIEPDGIKAILKCRNRNDITLRLTKEMISAYDNMELGTQNINITTDAYVGKAKVVVKQRHEYIEKLKKDLEKIKIEKLVLSDKEKINELQDRFDVLTSYEVTLLGEKAIENLKLARKTLDAVMYAGIADVDMMVYETMDTQVKWMDDLSSRSVGYVNHRNGYLAESQKAYDLWGTVFTLHPTYGSAVAVSADLMKIDDAYFCGLVMNRNIDGYYYLSFSDDTDDGTHKIQLRRKTGSVGTIVAASTIENYGFECKAGEWFNLTMTYVDGILHGFYNGVEVVSYDDSINNVHFEEGYSGLFMSGSDFRADNLRVYGTVLEKADDVYVEPVNYIDDFEDEAVGERPSHWIEPATYTDGMYNHYRVYSLYGSKVYGTKDTKTNTMSYLHVFDKNTIWESDFYVGSTASDAILGFVYRMSPEDTFVKVGFNFAEKRWFVYQERNDGSKAIVTKSEKTYSIPKDTKNTIRIALDDGNMVLAVNGEEVISLQKDEIVCDGYGRVGIYTEKAQMYIDNVNVTLACGVEPNTGVLEYIFEEPAIGYSATQVIDMGKGQMIAIVNKGKHAYRSYNWGETWEDITHTDGVELLSIQNGYSEILKLSNGKYISVRSASYEVYVSDDMLHWELLSQVKMPYKYDEVARKYVDENNRENSMHHINSLLEYKLPDGTNRIMLAIGVNGFADDTTQTRGSSNMKTETYYSDDYGVTWIASKNDTTEVDLAYVDENNLGQWGESKMLLCSDGVLRMYTSRSYSSYLIYTESHDYGETWTGLQVIPELQIPVASISMEEDPYNPGVYYLAWVNNVPGTYGSGSPRIRLSLARSTDGVNWKYLTDVERMITRYDVDVSNTTALYQIIDPSITITEKHIYVNYGRSQRRGDASVTAQSIAHGQVGRRYTKLVKANLTEKEWSSANIADVKLAKTMKITEMPTLKFGLGDIFALAGGEITVTALDGTTSTREFDEFMVYEEPDMYTYGKQTVLLYDKDYMQLTVEVEIVDKYKVTWNIIGDGEIEPKKTSVLDGDDYTFTLTPGGKVSVNGNTLNGKNNSFTIEDIREDIEITVEFSKGIGVIQGVLIATLVLLFASVGVATFWIKKKGRKNTNKIGESENAK